MFGVGIINIQEANSMKKIYFLFLMFLYGLLVGSLAAQTADQNYQNGIKAFENGYYEQALNLFETSAKQYQKAKDRTGSANAYNYAGLVLQMLNQHERAAGYFEKAAGLFIQSGNKSGGASAIANWGISAYRAKLDSQKQKGRKMTLKMIGTFLAYHLKAKQLHEELKDYMGVADDLNNIANMYIEAEFYDSAMTYLNQALSIHTKLGSKGGMATDLANIGRIYFRNDQISEALKYYFKSAEIFEDIGDREGAWRTYSFIGTIYDMLSREQDILGNTDAAAKYRQNAITALKKSVDHIESLRGNFSNKDYFESFLKDKNPVYKRLISLLKRSNMIPEALLYIERSKAKLSNDVIQAGKIQVVDKKEQEYINKIEDLQKKNEELEKQLAEEKAKPVEKQNKEKIDQLSKTLTKNQGDFNALMIDLETKYPNIYQVIKVDPIQLTDIQSQLPDDVALLQYFPADDALYIFLITKTKVEAKSVPVPATRIDSLINRYRYLIGDVTSLLKRNRFDLQMKDWKPGADARFYERHTKPLRDIMVELHDYLILPVWNDVNTDQIKTLTIIPAASLYYLPFQCLATETKDGDLQFLIEKKAVNYLTAATLMDLVTKKKQKQISNVLVFGNPDGSLPGAEEEAKVIQAAFSSATLFKNQNATKEKARTLAGQYDVVHFATHGFLSSDEPQKSFLLMAPNAATNEDDKLTISEILKLPLKDRNDLIVLSACNTSMGKSATGVELISLSRSFAIAGAPTVVATLWPVDDESTKMIMIRFYDGLKKGLSKAEAMRQAQISLIRKGDYHLHPFFWAPFVMIGNAK